MKKRVERLPMFEKRLMGLKGEMSQDKFAKFLGISRPTMGFYLNGDRLPSALFIRKICEKCNVSSDYLLGLSDVKSCDMDIKCLCNLTGLGEQYIEQILKMKEEGNIYELENYLDFLDWKEGHH